MNLWTQVDTNKRRSAFFLVFFVILVTALGWLFSYAFDSPIILVIAIVIALGQSLIGYYSGDSIILSSTGAVEIEKKDNPELWRIVENLSITAGLPLPKIYIVEDEAPNAFATGRDPNHASIAVTTGLLRRLDKNELSGVIAHELSHVGNFDIRLMMVVVILVSVIAILSDLFLRSRWFGFGRKSDNNEGGQIQLILMIVAIVAAIIAPVVAMLVQLAISRKREFLADADGSLLTRYPEGLASALQKISKYSEPMEKVSTATSHLWISNPLGSDTESKKVSWFARIFSTHPPIEERIRILRGMNI